MRLFLELIRLSFRRQAMYRAAMLAGLATNIFFGLLRAAVLVALYAGQEQVEGISLVDAITYTGLTQGVIAFLSLFNWTELMRTVYTGAVASDLLKPMDYFSFWMAQDLGRALASLLLRGFTIMAIYALAFRITVPRPGQLLALVAAFALAWLVSFSWRFLVNLAAFWTPNAIGIGRLAFGLSWFLSGFLMPLRFLPDWFVRLCYLTPFPHIVNTLTEIYLGLLDGPQILAALAGQAAWAGILFLAGQLVLRRGIQHLVIQGG